MVVTSVNLKLVVNLSLHSREKTKNIKKNSSQSKR